MIAQQLQWHGVQDRLQTFRCIRHLHHGNTGLTLETGLRTGKHEQFAAAGTHFLQVGFQFFQQFVVWRNHDYRHIGIHQRQRAVLQLAGGVGFGMDVGNFFQLQRAFQRNRVFHPAPKEQCVMLLRKCFTGGFNQLIKASEFFHQSGQLVQRLHQLGFSLAAQAVGLGQGNTEQLQRHQLSGECLGGGNANFRAGLGHQMQFRLAYQRAVGHIANGHGREVAKLLGLAQRGQRIRGFARLGDGDEQGTRTHRGLAVANLTGHFHGAGHTGPVFDPVAGHEAGVIAGTAGDDLDLLHLGQDFVGRRSQCLRQH